MKTFFLTFVALVFTGTIYGQDFKGVAIYQSKTKVDVQIDSTTMPKERINEFKEMLNKRMEKRHILTFNKAESVYVEEQKQDPVANGNFVFRMGSSDIYYKNLKEKRYVRQTESFSKEFLVKDSLPEYQWNLENESKTIGDYLCFKATAIKEVPDMSFEFGPGRNKKGNNTEQPQDSVKPKTKQITITAWYSPEIPINNGPSEYGGLPGLILELNVEKTQYLCTELVLNAKNAKEITEPSKGKVVTQKEHEEIMRKKMEEMREMYQGQGRKEGGNGSIIIKM